VSAVLDPPKNGRMKLLQMTIVHQEIALKLYLEMLVVPKVGVANTVSLDHIVCLGNFQGAPLLHHQLHSVKLDHWTDPNKIKHYISK
jgi:hypothetical protein